VAAAAVDVRERGKLVDAPQPREILRLPKYEEVFGVAQKSPELLDPHRLLDTVCLVDAALIQKTEALTHGESLPPAEYQEEHQAGDYPVRIQVHYMDPLAIHEVEYSRWENIEIP
jgi:hypothetical protein